MKKALLVLFCIIGCAPLFGQVPRLILLEDFTEASSDASFLSAPGIYDMAENNSNSMVRLQYHTAFQGIDPMNLANPVEVQTRAAFYNITTVPSVAMDGNAFNGVPDNLNQPDINNRLSVLSPFAVSINHQLSPNNDSVYVSAVVRATQPFNSGIKAYMAVSERIIYFASAPGTTPQNKFENVMKKMLPGDQGIMLPVAWAVADSVVINESWKLTGVYDINQLAIVFWVQDTLTKEIIQTSYSRNKISLDIGVKEAVFNEVICPQTFLPKVKVKNYGTDVLTSCTVGFITTGGVDTSHAWVGIIDSDTTGIIALDSISPLPGVNILATAALLPNGGIDLDPMNDSNYFRFTVIDTVIQPPYTEGFENAIFPPSHWALANKNNDLTWEQDLVSSYEGNKSARISFYNGTKLRIDELYIPALDFSTATVSMKLYFAYAYTFFTENLSSRYDTLSIMASTDCGDNWTTLWEKGGLDLQTAVDNNLFFVPSASEWLTDSTDLSSFNGVPQVLIKFSGKSGRGNNLYLDKIVVNSFSTGIAENDLFPNFSIYPTPTTGKLTISFSSLRLKQATVSIIDPAGKIRMHRKILFNLDKKDQLDLTALENGVYFATILAGDQLITKKIVIVH